MFLTEGNDNDAFYIIQEWTGGKKKKEEKKNAILLIDIETTTPDLIGHFFGDLDGAVHQTDSQYMYGFVFDNEN